MPPVAFGCVCQFLYTMYVNVEQFSRKTRGMAFASVIAACSNFVLNYLSIPRFGYISAAYTTLASFAILLFIHMFLVKKIGLGSVYSTKSVFLVLLLMSLTSLLVYRLYLYNDIRYAVITVYVIITIYILVKNKDALILLLKRNNQ